MTDPTTYLADFELTTLVRTVGISNGITGKEPLWFQGGNEKGLTIFASPLDAEIYRQFAVSSESIGWKRASLAQFDLLEHIKAAGGHLSCQLTCGFSATMSGELHTQEGLVRPLLVPVSFDAPPETPAPVTFRFQNWISEFIRQQWAVIGPSNYAAQVECVNAAPDAELVELAKYAKEHINSSDTKPEIHDWCLFDPESQSWHFVPTELRQNSQLH